LSAKHKLLLSLQKSNQELMKQAQSKDKSIQDLKNKNEKNEKNVKELKEKNAELTVLQKGNKSQQLTK